MRTGGGRFKGADPLLDASQNDTETTSIRGCQAVARRQARLFETGHGAGGTYLIFFSPLSPKKKKFVTPLFSHTSSHAPVSKKLSQTTGLSRAGCLVQCTMCHVQCQATVPYNVRNCGWHCTWQLIFKVSWATGMLGGSDFVGDLVYLRIRGRLFIDLSRRMPTVHTYVKSSW